MSNESSGTHRTSIGGQALIEGIFMRGPKKQATVVRDQHGVLHTRVEPVAFTKDRFPLLALPFLRGCVMFGDSIVSGTRALLWSAEFFPEEDTKPSKLEAFIEKRFGSGTTLRVLTTFAAVLGILFSIGLFVFLPTLLTGGLLYFFPEAPLWLRNLLEGVAKVAIFLLYLFLCSKMPDIRRTFCYHGAEHKCIACYEKGLPLTVAHVRTMPREHPRCGTSFLFVVIVLSIVISGIVFALPFVRELAGNTLLRIAIHLILLPLVVSITYELNRLLGRSDGKLARLIRAPGLALQQLTTFEPDDAIIEVGIEALRLVLPEDAGDDTW